MNNTQRVSSPFWEQYLNDASIEAPLETQQANDAAVATDSLMTRVDSAFSQALWAPPSPLFLDPPERAREFEPNELSSRDQEESAQIAHLASENFVPTGLAEQPQETGASSMSSRKRQRETPAASSSSSSSAPFENIHADFVQLLEQHHRSSGRAQPLYSLLDNIVSLILLIDKEILLQTEEKERLIALFDRAKKLLPPTQDDNPWLDLFCQYPDFETRLLEILGEKTFLQLVNSLVEEDPEQDPSGFDNYFLKFESTLKQRTDMPENTPYERTLKRSKIKQAISDRKDTWVKRFVPLTEPQADLFVQLLIKTGQKYPHGSHPLAQPFYKFCEENLKEILGPQKLNQLVHVLKNSLQASPVKADPNAFDRDFLAFQSTLQQRADMPENTAQDRSMKRSKIKEAISNRKKTWVQRFVPLTEPQADRLVQLLIKTGQKYPPGSNQTEQLFYVFCENNLKEILRPEKLDQLVRALKNQLQASSSSSSAKNVGPLNARNLADPLADLKREWLARHQN